MRQLAQSELNGDEHTRYHWQMALLVLHFEFQRASAKYNSDFDNKHTLKCKAIKEVGLSVFINQLKTRLFIQ